MDKKSQYNTAKGRCLLKKSVYISKRNLPLPPPPPIFLLQTFLFKPKKDINSFAESLQCAFHSNLEPFLVCIYCRHILASLHFNENLLREPQKTKDGKDYLLVTYPKYKFGEEVVREISVPPTYSK